MPINPVFLNGKWLSIDQAMISPLDRGFLFADGCYEVIPIYNQKVFRLSDHLQRLEYSLQSLGIDSGYSNKDWVELFSHLVKQTDDKNYKSYIYLQITRGVESKRDHIVKEAIVPTVFCYAENTATLNDLPEAISVTLQEDIRWHRGDIKAISLLGSVLARRQAMDEGYDDCIFYRDNEIVESSSSNLFIVEGGVVKTPPLSNWLLGGITRLVLLELLEKYRIPFSVEPISVEQLHHASEIWLSSSIKELIPVRQIDGQLISNGEMGEVLKKIWDCWRQYIHSYSENQIESKLT